MQQHALVSAEERSRAGRAHLYTTIAQNAARPRKRSKNPLTERGQDTVLIWCIVIPIVTYLAGHIWQGLPAILARHGF